MTNSQNTAGDTGDIIDGFVFHRNSYLSTNDDEVAYVFEPVNASTVVTADTVRNAAVKLTESHPALWDHFVWNVMKADQMPDGELAALFSDRAFIVEFNRD